MGSKGQFPCEGPTPGGSLLSSESSSDPVSMSAAQRVLIDASRVAFVSFTSAATTSARTSLPYFSSVRSIAFSTRTPRLCDLDQVAAGVIEYRRDHCAEVRRRLSEAHAQPAEPLVLSRSVFHGE